MDPIADMLASIKNANQRAKDRIDVPFSKTKLEIARLLKQEGFIANFKSLYDASKKGSIRIFIKYSPTKEPVVRGIKRVSKPGLRIYVPYKEIPRDREGFAVSILSTSLGIMTDKQAREKKVGGEILCRVW